MKEKVKGGWELAQIKENESDVTSKYNAESLIGFWLEGKTAVKAIRRQAVTSVGEDQEKPELTACGPAREGAQLL